MKFSPPRGARAITPFLLSILALPAVAIAGTQEQLGENASSQIEFSEPTGQTFTADSDPALVSIGFGLKNDNSNNFNGNTTVRLYEGVGDGGTLIATVVEELPDLPAFTEIFYDFDFSGENVQLTPGQVYTALIYRFNSRWSLQRNNPLASPFAPDYAGGHLVSSGVENTTQDARFRVVTAPSVPMLGPLGALALTLGVVGTGWRRLRRAG